jgi:hypothetical protein
MYNGNQAKAQRSTGLKTDPGKQRARLNAYKHGLTDAFEKRCQAIVEALAPVGIIEGQRSQSVAEDRWRLNRVRALESGICGQLGEIGDSLYPFRDNAAQFQVDQPLINLALLQAKTWLAAGNNIQHPAACFPTHEFVFSSPEIRHPIARNRPATTAWPKQPTFPRKTCRPPPAPLPSVGVPQPRTALPKLRPISPLIPAVVRMNRLDGAQPKQSRDRRKWFPPGIPENG